MRGEKLDPATLFLNALAWKLPPEQRLILCGFAGDPDEAEPADWKPRPWKPGNEIPFGRKSNAYVCVSSFGRMPDGSFRRRQGSFAGGRALMIDDLGTKVPMSTIKNKRPSALIETSPGNFQAWFLFERPELDQERFRGMISAFIKGKLLGNDPGMAGVTRVGRLPGYFNGKSKYNGFTTKLHEFDPKARYSTQAILDLFGLKIEGRNKEARAIPKDIADGRNDAFETVERFLRNNNMLKRRAPDLGGWTEMHCPWVGEHTGSADTGAAIREPARDNQYFGAFRCHHGHCTDRGWSDLTDWIATLAAEAVTENDLIQGKRMIEKYRKYHANRTDKTAKHKLSIRHNNRSRSPRLGAERR